MSKKGGKAAPAEKPVIAHLTVKVLSGHSLPNVDTGVLGDVSDPYVKVSLGAVTKKTPTIDNNLNPVWSKDNEFSFEVTSLSDKLEFEVFDEGKLRDRTIGKTSVFLKGLQTETTIQMREKLEGAASGELAFEVLLEPVYQKIDFEAEKQRLTKLIVAASEKAPQKVAPYLKQAAPILATLVVSFMTALPYILKVANMFNKIIEKMPENILYASIGCVVCFFGGIFPATIAAAEAWMLCGGTKAVEALKDLYTESVKALVATKKDDGVDANNDGIPDVDQIGSQELLVRKVSLVAKTIDPAKVNAAVGCLFTGWLGVLATLQIRFARTITLGQVIGDCLYKVASHAEPLINSFVPEEYHKWTEVAVRWACKVTAISVAWWIERVISAFHSAIRGGLLFARHLLAFCNEKGYLKFEDHNKSYLDEMIGWSIAAFGFVLQFMLGFSAPFPLNVVLFPLTVLETFVIWSVSA
mmetsp:Transcript_53999/g.150177  ORF Transcript_53999/g.150177 Transcript_53999/m.150177 type:complete len:469 (-) Transcript_53999:112-1518(-)